MTDAAPALMLLACLLPACADDTSPPASDGGDSTGSATATDAGDNGASASDEADDDDPPSDETADDDDTSDSSASTDTTSDAGDTSTGESTTDESTTGAPAGVCGDGIVDRDEACDDGRATETCTDACTFVPGAVVWQTTVDDATAAGLDASSDTLWVAGQSAGAPALSSLDPDDGAILLSETIDEIEVGFAGEVRVDDEGMLVVTGLSGDAFSGEGLVWRLDTNIDVAWSHVFAPSDSPLFSSRPLGLAVTADTIVAVGGPGSPASAIEQLALDGTVLDSASSFANQLVAAAVAPDASIVIVGELPVTSALTTIFPDGLIFGPQPFSPRYARDVAIADDGEIHVVGGQDEGWLIVGQPTSDKNSVIPLPMRFPGGLAIDADGNVDVVGVTPEGDGVVIVEVDPATEAIVWTTTLPLTAEQYGAGDIGIDAQGRVFACGSMGNEDEAAQAWMTQVAG